MHMLAQSVLQMCAKPNAPTSICVNQLVALQGPLVNYLITNINKIVMIITKIKLIIIQHCRCEGTLPGIEYWPARPHCMHTLYASNRELWSRLLSDTFKTQSILGKRRHFKPWWCVCMQSWSQGLSLLGGSSSNGLIGSFRLKGLANKWCQIQPFARVSLACCCWPLGCLSHDLNTWVVFESLPWL